MTRPHYRRRLRGIAGGALCAIMAVGCASDESGRRAVAELASLQRELGEMRGLQEANARELAELASRLRGLESDTAALAKETRGKVGEAQPQASRADMGIPRAERGGEAQPQASRADMGMPRAERGGEAQVGRGAAAGEASGSGRPGEHERAPATAPPAARPSAGDDLQAERLYASAMANVRASEPGQAVLELSELIARFPGHPLAAAAQLGIGEAYHQQGDFRQALLELQKVVEDHPASPQVAAALLAIGLCHRSLGAPARAAAAWRKLVNEHPGTAAAARARALLAARTGGARRSR